MNVTVKQIFRAEWKNQRPLSRLGFSLIELMVVITILGILAALLMPAMSSMGGARNVEYGGQQFLEQLNLARQEAITRNRPVEFRVYEFRDRTEGSTDAEMRGFQYFVVEADSTNQISRPVYLPTGVIISGDSMLTSLVGLTNVAVSSGPIGSRADGNYSYRSIGFRSDGSTDLAYGAKHFATIKHRTDSENPPRNYYTVVVEPTTGRAQTFRP